MKAKRITSHHYEIWCDKKKCYDFQIKGGRKFVKNMRGDFLTIDGARAKRVLKAVERARKAYFQRPLPT